MEDGAIKFDTEMSFILHTEPKLKSKERFDAVAYM
jgi:hypothetical protein